MSLVYATIPMIHFPSNTETSLSIPIFPHTYSSIIPAHIFYFLPVDFFRKQVSAKPANCSWVQAVCKNGCISSCSAVARRSGEICKHCAKKWLNSCDQRYRLLFSVGDLFVVMSKSARKGGSLSNGGSPSAISIAVIPKLQISTWKWKIIINNMNETRQWLTLESYSRPRMSSGAIQ